MLLERKVKTAEEGLNLLTSNWTNTGLPHAGPVPTTLGFKACSLGH